jgi:hypothetical protein
MICSFFGHRKIENKERVQEIMEGEIERAIEAGCRVFYFGGFGEFDELCYRLVTEIKEACYSLGIQRIFCVPQEWYLRKKSKYFNEGDYEDIIYLTPSFEGWYKSIYFRNCAMIDMSDWVIFYAEDRENSGAFKAFKYARKKKNKTIVNIWGA